MGIEAERVRELAQVARSCGLLSLKVGDQDGYVEMVLGPLPHDIEPPAERDPADVAAEAEATAFASSGIVPVRKG